ncbi:tetratricopeptide repeat protein [Marinobacterium sp. D7]|uniref:tetratricopeptide repeat protein n=1 Tax=Marinobacterium ramblicola TaxID=2849041 RepID=UPI001C2D05A0|nr:tetratricopeptide repeat protein [Marinobacterium ramblicola]MBV1787740.1 tetratricopeptide repeat protein [Marinobacterium ramblicola]
MPDQKPRTQVETLLIDATEQAKQGNLDEAISTLKSLLALEPNHELSLGMLASVYLQLGLTQQASDLFEQLLETYPENPLARFQLGMAKLNSSDPKGALETWRPMLEMKDEFMANFHSALAHLQLGSTEQARECLERASQHMPQTHPLYPQLVNLYGQLTERMS